AVEKLHAPRGRCREVHGLAQGSAGQGSGDTGQWGAGEALTKAGLVDEYILLIHPLVLGTGRRLFGDDGSNVALRLIDTKTTTTGVVIATYEAMKGWGSRSSWMNSSRGFRRRRAPP